MRIGRLVKEDFLIEQITQVYNEFVYPIEVASTGLQGDINTERDSYEAQITGLYTALDTAVNILHAYDDAAWATHVANYH